MNYSSPSALLFRDASAPSLSNEPTGLSSPSSNHAAGSRGTVAYTQEFAEILAERRPSRRAALAHSATDDARHAPTLVAGALACVFAAGTCVALWHAVAAGMVVPSENRPSGLAIERSLALAPFAFAIVPIHALMELARPAVAPQATGSGDVDIGAAAAMDPQGMSPEVAQGPGISIASGQSVVVTGAATKVPTVTAWSDQLTTPPPPVDAAGPANIPPNAGESGPLPFVRTTEPQLGTIRTASTTGSSGDTPSSSSKGDATVATANEPSDDQPANAPAAEDAAKSEDSAAKNEKSGKAKSKADADQNGGKGQSGKGDGSKGKGGKAGKGDGGKDKGGKGKGGKGGGGD